MPTSLILSLQVTLVGMGLVFAAILLLWLMIQLLVANTAERQTAAPPAATAEAEAGERELRRRAAVAAVSLALAEQQASTAHPLSTPPTALVSAWQLGRRTRQMYEKGSHR
jgi:Na+-transporting methylmalonyl-CoA/oxaloacetate decarboxylase gamma subunit